MEKDFQKTVKTRFREKIHKNSIFWMEKDGQNIFFYV
ncbi:hypothetical protein SAMN04488559_107106 [Isobaculum melis]|uniref:Uncharacterized protein n=1 Tax=Isobaculum melis TaxID=142588 RepID=A0A1H9SGL5_9LACT|nr:hypothetical protein SAMN04488559_107106 [Isobaculum melis]